jgi:hypothetical protein
MSVMAGDHYLQAALLGRWGRSSVKGMRYWKVQAKIKRSGQVCEMSPDALGKVNGLYPPWLEKVWHTYEGDLLRVAADLERGRLTSGDEQFLLLHAAALKPRGQTFIDDLNAHQAEYDLPPFDENALHIERVKTIIRTLHYVTTWRWRVLHAPQDEPFAINDKGGCEFSDHDWPGRGVFFPLGPTVGLLGFLYRPERHRRVFQPFDFTDHLTLNKGYASLLNVHAWEDATYFLVGRHDQTPALEQLADKESIRYDPSGPYRFRRFGFFEDAS